MSKRAYRYHPSCPDGQIFTGDEIAKADADGWVDSPAKLGEVVSQEDPVIELAPTPEPEPEQDQPLDQAPPVATEPKEWPELRDGVWYDSSNTAFDPAAHVKAQDAEAPTTNKDGTFRKLPAAK